MPPARPILDAGCWIPDPPSLWGYGIPRPPGVESGEGVEGVGSTTTRARARYRYRLPAIGARARGLSPPTLAMGLWDPPPTRCGEWRRWRRCGEYDNPSPSPLPLPTEDRKTKNEPPLPTRQSHKSHRSGPRSLKPPCIFRRALLPVALPEVAPFDNVGTREVGRRT